MIGILGLLFCDAAVQDFLFLQVRRNVRRDFTFRMETSREEDFRTWTQLIITRKQPYLQKSPISFSSSLHQNISVLLLRIQNTNEKISLGARKLASKHWNAVRTNTALREECATSTRSVNQLRESSRISSFARSLKIHD